MDESLPPGFRFHPTDEELITYYLTRKVSEFGFVTRAIADVDLNKCEPWDLPAKASMGEKEWYFFSMKDRKYPTGLRTNRATDAGYWKTTGKDKEIFHCGMLVGMKKTLVFYKGRAPKGEKTNWVMHEYRHQTKFPYKPNKEEWVVCRVFKKSSNCKRPTPDSPMDSQCNTTSLSELGEIDVSILNNLVNTSSATNGLQNGEHFNPAKIDMATYMNWMLAREATSQPSLPWPAATANLLAPVFSANPAILKALPMAFNGYPQRDGANVTNLGSFVGQGDGITSFASSSSRGIENGEQQPQQQPQQHPAQLDQEGMWRGY
ncbi:hypothetical protein LUZ61_015224 [Rhynchospora tenuis]|uniref:NAC domain-containing protein n=1 Tax=Rhynchospora tenuis TaxID=198213 RepID=A0AAD5Z1X8_9POAL|nr:hypothetical protein LUZ61_015224 [Rhynchospora tenuis]